MAIEKVKLDPKAVAVIEPEIEILPPILRPDKAKNELDKTIDTLDKVDKILDKAIPLVERAFDKWEAHKGKKKDKEKESTGDPQLDYLKDAGLIE